METALPKTINVSMYTIDCSGVRKALIDSAFQHVEALLKSLSTMTIEKCKAVESELQEIMFQSQKPSQGLEDTLFTKQILEETPQKVEFVDEFMLDIRNRLDLLREFDWMVSEGR